jgi:pentatricopeptide repeat protein
VLPRLERALVVAAEGVRQYRKRRLLRLRPGTMDALMAVQALKERGFAPPPSPPLPSPAGAADPPPSRGARLHAARQGAALEVAGALSAVGGGGGVGARRGEARMAALVGMSERLLSGAHWLVPGAGAAAPTHASGNMTTASEHYSPGDGRARRVVLLREAEAIYSRELARAGLEPDRVTLNTMLGAYCAAGLSARAHEFLRVEFARWGVQPDARTFRTLVGMHVRARRTEQAERVLALMREQGVAPDKDTFGLLVHARARENRLRDAIALLEEMQAAGHTCTEHYAALLRVRCREAGIMHPSVPAHPVAWQFTPKVMAMRRSRSKMKLKIAKLLRPKIGKYR